MKYLSFRYFDAGRLFIVTLNEPVTGLFSFFLGKRRVFPPILFGRTPLFQGFYRRKCGYEV